MYYKKCLYAIFLMLGIFIMSGINIEKILKKGKEIEANLLVISISCIFSYLLTNFVWDFLSLS